VGLFVGLVQRTGWAASALFLASWVGVYANHCKFGPDEEMHESIVRLPAKHFDDDDVVDKDSTPPQP
jgi:hypothetical protein